MWRSVPQKFDRRIAIVRGEVYIKSRVLISLLFCFLEFLQSNGYSIDWGRMPTESDERGNNYSYVFNRQMRDKWNMEPNDIMRIPWLEGGESADGSVIGFVDDVKFTSFCDKASPN